MINNHINFIKETNNNHSQTKENESIKVCLKSDFLDYYDHWFERYSSDIPCLYRNSNQGMSRLEMFSFFENMGLDLPIYGTVTEVYQLIEKKLK